MRGRTEGFVGPDLACARLPLSRKGKLQPLGILVRLDRSQALSIPIAQEQIKALTRVNHPGLKAGA